MGGEIQPRRREGGIAPRIVVKGWSTTCISFEGVENTLDQLTGFDEERGGPIAESRLSAVRSRMQLFANIGDEPRGTVGAPAISINEHDRDGTRCVGSINRRSAWSSARKSLRIARSLEEGSCDEVFYRNARA